jgi:hypothetical protein
VHGDYGGSESFLNAAWNDFEAGQFDDGNIYLEQNNVHQWSLPSTGNRAGSTRYAQKVYIDSELGEIAHNQSGSTGTWFVSFWMRLDSLADQQSGKFYRIWGDHSNVWIATGGGDLTIRGYSECATCSPAPATVWGSPYEFSENAWQRVDIEMRQDPDLFAVYLDGVLEWRRSSALAGEEQSRWVPNPFDGDGHTLGIGGMLDSPSRGYPANGFYHFDDFFVDYTFARVELCAGSTWASHGVCEVQIPTMWETYTLALSANTGALPDGSAYLYVVDSTGAVNATGFPVTIGGTPDTTPPSAPSGLGVQ